MKLFKIRTVAILTKTYIITSIANVRGPDLIKIHLSF